MSDINRPRAPKGLGPAGRRFWKAILADYDLSAGEVELLRQACRVVNLVDRADEALAADNLVVPGSRGQPVINPLAGETATQRRVLEHLIRSMALPWPGEDEGHVRSPAAREAAQQRWREQRQSG